MSRTRRKIETYYVFVKNNTTNRKKLQDLQQRTTHDSRSSYEIEEISTRCYKEV